MNVCFFGFGLAFLTLTVSGLVQTENGFLSSAHSKVEPASPAKVNVAFLDFDFFFGPLPKIGAPGAVVSTVTDVEPLAAWE